MQPLFVVLALVLAFSTLHDTSVTAVLSGLGGEIPKKNEGYRCGRKIFRQEFLESVRKSAKQNYAGGESSNTAPNDKVSNLWFWTIPDQQSLSETGDLETHLLVLNYNRDWIENVVSRRKNEYKKCIKEPDLSDFSGDQLATGYRCPLAIFPFATIHEAIQDAKKYAEEWKMAPGRKNYFKSFDTERIFREIKDTSAWPVASNGSPDKSGSASIVVDKDFEFVGMVYKKNKRYFRCVVTTKNQIIPKFVGQSLEQQPEKVDSQNLDVFECGPGQFILSNEVLLGASYATPRFTSQWQHHSVNTYPYSYTSATVASNEDLFTWPINIDAAGHYYRTNRFSKSKNILLIINYFSDVHNVKMYTPLDGLITCQRKAVDWRIYQNSLKQRQGSKNPS